MRCAVALWLAVAAFAWDDPSPHALRAVQVNGGTLSYLDWGGSGFLSGFGQSPHIFDDLAPKFATVRHVLGLTRRGCCGSVPAKAVFDTAALEGDLVGFLKALQVDKADFVAFSMAGAEVTELALRHPDLVGGIVYVDSAYDFSADRPEFPDDPIKLEPGPEDNRNLEAGKQWFIRTFGFWSPAVEADARVVNLRPDGTMSMQAYPPEVGRALWKGFTSYKPRFHSVKAPALAIFVVPEHHPMVPPDSSRATRAAADRWWRERRLPALKRAVLSFQMARPDARTVLMRDTQHLCFIRERDERRVYAEILRFLTSNP